MTKTDRIKELYHAGTTDTGLIAKELECTRKLVSSVLRKMRNKLAAPETKVQRFRPMKGLNAHQRQAVGAWKPRQAQEGEAGSKFIDLMRQPVYETARHNTNHMMRSI